MYLTYFLILLNFINFSPDKVNNSLKYHHKQSDIYYHQGNYPEMIYHCLEIVKLDPKDVETWSSIGYYYWSMGVDNKSRKDEFNLKALKYLTEGIKANAESYYLYDEVGKFYLNKSKDFISAIEYFELAITKKDCTNIPFHILSKCYLSINNSEKAKNTLVKCIDKFPNDEKARVDLIKLN